MTIYSTSNTIFYMTSMSGIFVMVLLVLSSQANAGKVKKVTTNPVWKAEFVFESLLGKQKEENKIDGREALQSIHLKLTNVSKQNQIFCQEPVLETLTWVVTRDDGQRVENLKSGSDIDYDYSSQLTESNCFVIKPKESFVLPESALLTESKQDFYLSISFLCEYGPMKKGNYRLSIHASNAAVKASTVEEKKLIHSLKAKNRAGDPVHVDFEGIISLPPKPF